MAQDDRRSEAQDRLSGAKSVAIAFVSRHFAEAYGEELKAAAARAGNPVELMLVPEKAGSRLTQSECDRITCTYLDRGTRFDEQLNGAFEAAMVATRTCKWIHLTSSGVNPAPFMAALDAIGAVITSSTGSNAEPVAQTGFTGLLMLARGFPGYVQGQHRHEWRPMRGAALPEDLRGQTLLLIGVGAIGKTFTGYAHAFGLHVVGVRRSSRREDDPVDELHPPSELLALLPRADWIVIACPLTRETRNLLNAEAFKHVKPGARLINIARGEIVDQNAIIEALKSGVLAGAHLDAHTQEPLPADSPLWDMPNVIVTPHNASASTGNDRRAARIFIANYERWARGEPMLNVQTLS